MKIEMDVDENTHVGERSGISLNKKEVQNLIKTHLVK